MLTILLDPFIPRLVPSQLLAAPTFPPPDAKFDIEKSNERFRKDGAAAAASSGAAAGADAVEPLMRDLSVSSTASTGG